MGMPIDWDTPRFAALLFASVLLGFTLKITLSKETGYQDAKPIPVEMSIYQGNLEAGWQDWSWANHMLQSGTVIHGDHASIKMVPEGYKGVYLHKDDVDTRRFKSLWLWINGSGKGGQKIDVMAVDRSKKFGPKVDIGRSTSAGAIPPNRWVLAIIPLEKLNASKTNITGFVFADSTGKLQDPVYLSDIKLVGDAETGPNYVSLDVDVRRDVHPISPYIYGLAHTSREELLDLGIKSHRWGGNPNSRYNWEINAWNHARDWQFSNYGNQKAEDRVPGSVADGHIMTNRLVGAATIMTIPTIGYVARDISDSSRSEGVPAEGGNSISNGSEAIHGYNPATNQLRTSVKSFARKRKQFVYPPDPTDNAVYQDEWVNHLVQKFGKADSGGVQFYAMDNEPDIWDSTHTDIHPARMGYDQLLTTFLEYATAVKDVDSTAKITGPVSWGWTGYFHSPKDRPNWNARPDRKAHGDLPFIPWFLQEVKRHDANTGKRTLDVLDIHYYPQAGGVFDNKTDASVNAARIRSVKSLWDSNYRDESWIGDTIRLIPRMNEWINQYYPGTKLGITEWNFGADTTMNGAIAIAETLGVFGKNNVYLANYWTAPKPKSPGYFAFKLFGNVDGSGTGFGDKSVFSQSSNPDEVSIFSSIDSQTQKPILIVINKNPARDVPVRMKISGTNVTSNMVAYRYSDREPNTIEKISDIDLKSGEALFIANRYSIYLLKCK